MPQPLYQYSDPLVLLDAADQDINAYLSLSQTFLNIAPPMYERLQRALLAGDNKEAQFASHSLVGTVTLVRATEMARLLREINALCQAGDKDRIALHEHEMSRIFELMLLEVHASIRQHRDAAGAA